MLRADLLCRQVTELEGDIYREFLQLVLYETVEI